MLHKAKITIGNGERGEAGGYKPFTEDAAASNWECLRCRLERDTKGYQVAKPEGAWWNEKRGKWVREQCVQITLYQDKDQSYEDFIALLGYLSRCARALYEQDSVPVEVTELKAVIWV